MLFRVSSRGKKNDDEISKKKISFLKIVPKVEGGHRGNVIYYAIYIQHVKIIGIKNEQNSRNRICICVKSHLVVCGDENRNFENVKTIGRRRACAEAVSIFRNAFPLLNQSRRKLKVVV